MYLISPRNNSVVKLKQSRGLKLFIFLKIFWFAANKTAE